jgi:hypothetical protein
MASGFGRRDTAAIGRGNVISVDPYLLPLASPCTQAQGVGKIAHLGNLNGTVHERLEMPVNTGRRRLGQRGNDLRATGDRLDRERRCWLVSKYNLK